jgi:RND family efflux transporter MFP subunit
VLANVGDSVRRGQLLARISSDNVAADAAQARAGLAEAQAMLAEARANAERARQVQASGALSAQQISQYLTAEQTAQARLTAAQANVQAAELRLSQTRVLAPDDGVISARSAAVGSLAQPGQEMFRLIRGNRLEWRAEVTASELARIRPGMTALVQLPGIEGRVTGKVRMVAPTVDPQTRNALVYVDLPPGSGARAGMFARGELQLGKAAALTLPQTAVVMRDGFAYVFKVGADNRVAEVKIEVGRRVGDRVEVVRGIGADTRVVASGAGFLADGDLVRVTEALPAAPAKAAPAAPSTATAPARK